MRFSPALYGKKTVCIKTHLRRHLWIETCVYGRNRQKMDEVLARSLWRETYIHKKTLGKRLMNRHLCIWKEETEDAWGSCLLCLSHVCSLSVRNLDTTSTKTCSTREPPAAGARRKRRKKEINRFVQKNVGKPNKICQKSHFSNSENEKHERKEDSKNNPSKGNEKTSCRITSDQSLHDMLFHCILFKCRRSLLGLVVIHDYPEEGAIKTLLSIVSRKCY